MAEQQVPGIQNKRLLIVAAVLAAVVVIVYNVHIRQVRRAGRGRTIQLLRFQRDMELGEQITSKDLTVVPIDEVAAGNLGNVMGKEHLKFATQSIINQRVQKGQYLLWQHITQDEHSGPSRMIGKGMVAVSIDMDPRVAPGDILRVGDRVNILARLSVGRGPLKTYRVVEGLRVLAVGGRGRKQMAAYGKSRRPFEEGLRSYRSITVEVFPDVSLQLENVLSHKVGSVRVELLNPAEKLSATAGQINPSLQNLTGAAAPTRTGPDM